MPAAFFSVLAGACAVFAGAGCVSAGASAFSGSSVFSSSAPPSNAAIGISSPVTVSISDTAFAAALIFSKSVSSLSKKKENSSSNFSSSISCDDGLYTMICPKSSTALNTKNALAAFNRHSFWIFTVIA